MPPTESEMPSRVPIDQVLRQHTPALMAIEGVVGTYEGRLNSEPCIKVMVVTDTPELRARVPAVLDGYTVVLQETGEIGPGADP